MRIGSILLSSGEHYSQVTPKPPELIYERYNRYIELVYKLPSDAAFERQETIHRRSLAILVPQFHLEGLWTEQELDELVRLWYKLDGWPDSAGALARLKKMAPVIALSDGSVELLTSLDERGKLGFTQLWGSDTWQAYKPNPAVYLGAIKKLQLEPGEVALVAAHLSDLWAAKKCGMRAFYVERPFAERYSPEQIEKARQDGWVDMWIECGEGGLHGVANKFEAK